MIATVLLAAFIIDPPTSADYLWRFPSRAECRRMLDLNSAFRDHIGELRSLYGHAGCTWHNYATWGYGATEHEFRRYSLALRDAAILREPWQILEWVHDAADEDNKQVQLMRLRELLGVDRFRRGMMPQVIPCWK